MIGILIILIISALLLYFIEKKSLLVLGMTPIGKRLLQFGIGFLFFGMVNFLFIYLDAALKSGIWVFNPKVDLNLEYRYLRTGHLIEIEPPFKRGDLFIDQYS